MNYGEGEFPPGRWRLGSSPVGGQQSPNALGYNRLQRGSRLTVAVYCDWGHRSESCMASYCSQANP